MNYYLSRLNQEELINLINNFIKSAAERKWDGKRPAIESETNYVVAETNDEGKIFLHAKRIVGEYAVFDLGTFQVNDYSADLLVWGGKYLSFDTELHEYMALRYDSPYIEDFYQHEQERIVKENIRLMLLAGKARK